MRWSSPFLPDRVSFLRVFFYQLVVYHIFSATLTFRSLIPSETQIWVIWRVCFTLSTLRLFSLKSLGIGFCLDDGVRESVSLFGYLNLDHQYSPVNFCLFPSHSPPPPTFFHLLCLFFLHNFITAIFSRSVFSFLFICVGIRPFHYTLITALLSSIVTSHLRLGGFLINSKKISNFLHWYSLRSIIPGRMTPRQLLRWPETAFRYSIVGRSPVSLRSDDPFPFPQFYLSPNMVGGNQKFFEISEY